MLGMMLVKEAIRRGASPWTGTFLGNLWLAVIWVGVGVVRGEVIPLEVWTAAGVVGGLFLLGQVFTYLAFQYGDVSVATPVFGVKVLLVAVLTAVATSTAVPAAVWAGGAMASAGIVLIQWAGPQSRGDRRRQWLTILLAFSAAFSLTVFDVALQAWARDWSGYAFLPVLFGSAGLLSCGLLPFVDSPRRIAEIGATKWMLGGTLLMAAQATGMCFSLAEFGDAPRVNIVYALRGLWGVILAWLFARQFGAAEAFLERAVMIRRLLGAILLTAAVLLAIGAA